MHDFRIALRRTLFLSLAPLLAFTPPASRAQTPAASAASPDYVPTLTFDVASIRETNGVENGGLRVGVSSPTHTSKLNANNFSVKGLIQMAYGFDTPVSTGPDWMSTVYYNVEAKSDPSVDAKLAKMTDDQAKLEKQHMLQALLADRFQLKIHLETKESSVYALSVAKGGSKMHQVKVDSDSSDPNQPAPSAQGVDVQAHGGAQGLEFVVHSASMRAVVGLLSSQIESPVLDRTGLPGYYDFTLQIGRDWSATNPDAWPSIFTAVPEQLGLRLEATKAAVPNIVIDHIEKPSAN